MSNLLYSPASGIASQVWTTGLSKVTQSNCQVTLTDQGLRIYRPANLNPTDNGQTMWGGLRLINSTGTATHLYDAEKDNFFGLIKGHTYIIRCHISGKSSASASFGWSNQLGWAGGGLSPTPSNVKSHAVVANFNGEDECFYQFTINDNIIKTCTTTYSYATQGNEYLSYNHFGLTYNYNNTGADGTDIYISNLRMYDITNGEKVAVNIKGQVICYEPIEVGNIGSIQNSGNILGTNFYEY